MERQAEEPERKPRDGVDEESIPVLCTPRPNTRQTFFQPPFRQPRLRFMGRSPSSLLPLLSQTRSCFATAGHAMRCAQAS